MSINHTREVLYGKKPLHRTDRKPGQSEWYYLDPRGAETFSDMKQIDVESENTPNPFANELQNYLYNNDEYTYKALYGDEAPQSLNSNNSYTTESAWGYPNNSSSPFYKQMGEQYSKNQSSLCETDLLLQPYIFSEDMRNKLGQIESSNRYDAHNTDGGGFGAIGKYQIRRGGLIDIGYVDSNYNWTGKNGVYSINDFLSSPAKQEQILDEYLKSNYKQLKNKGAINYLGIPIQGITANFNITNTGLLAASHR